MIHLNFIWGINKIIYYIDKYNDYKYKNVENNLENKNNKKKINNINDEEKIKLKED